MGKSKKDWRRELANDFAMALSKAANSPSKRDTYEEAISISDGWQMRLDEIDKEEESEE
jgi:hypothetical protein